MKIHNQDYESLKFTVEVTANGFILTNENLTVTGWRKRNCAGFTLLTHELAAALGLLVIGEKITEIIAFQQT